MNQVISFLVKRVVGFIALFVVIQYVILTYLVPALAPAVKDDSILEVVGRIALFCGASTGMYGFFLHRFIQRYQQVGWRRKFPDIDLTGAWQTRYQSNKAQHEEGDIGTAFISQDWLGNITARGSYESRDATGVTDASWESTSFKLLEDASGGLRAIMSYHSRRCPRMGKNILAKDGESVRGIEELNVYPKGESTPARMDGSFFIYSQKAAPRTLGKASWQRIESDPPTAPPDVFLNSAAVFGRRDSETNDSD